MILSITGFMGCGKSSVGRELRRLLSWSFTDLDEYIEAKTGKTIPEIFASGSEASFRTIELDALKEVTESGSLVLALGGGTITTKECASLIQEKTVCIYLKGTVETLYSNICKTGISDRPMLKSDGDLKDRIKSLLSSREELYESIADYIIDIDGKSVKEIAGEIITRISPLSSDQPARLQ